MYLYCARGILRYWVWSILKIGSSSSANSQREDSCILYYITIICRSSKHNFQVLNVLCFFSSEVFQQECFNPQREICRSAHPSSMIQIYSLMRLCSVVEIISRHFCVFKSNLKKLQRVPEPPLVWPAPLIIDLPSHPSHEGCGTADPPLLLFLSCRGATRQRDQYLYGEGAGSGQRDECETEVHLHVHWASVSSVGGSVLELQALKFRTGWVGVYRLSLLPLPRTLVSLLF